jgi:hypothetical protein
VYIQFVLSDSSYFACLVLSNLVLGMLLAVSALAVGFSRLWNVDLIEMKLEDHS